MTKQVATNTLAFTREQIDLVKQTVARGATDPELQLFLYTAKRTGLDPLTKQIHAIKRWDSAAGKETMAIQTGIDGYRLIADRTGKLAGIDDAMFDREDKEHPEKATVTVYKIIDGESRPFTASARWNEYVGTKRDGTPAALWKKMPYHMLGKCAEALALRKAFPADLTGIYTFEEESALVEEEVVKRPQIPVISSGGPAAAPVEDKPKVEQPKGSPQHSPFESTPPKTATRKLSRTKKPSNYDKLIEFLASGNYVANDFLQVAKKNKWVSQSVNDLVEVPDPDLAQFLEQDNVQIIMDELEKLPRHTKD